MKTIQEKIQEIYHDCVVYENDEPIKDSIHCTDIEIDGVEYRCRHFSPPSFDCKTGITYYIVTEEQKDLKRSIESRFPDAKVCLYLRPV